MKFYRTSVTLICNVIIDLHEEKASPSRRERAIHFVLSQQAQMPDYLRLPVRFATLLFVAFFNALTPSKRVQMLKNSKKSFFSPVRDLIRFYESLVVLSLYDETPDV